MDVRERSADRMSRAAAGAAAEGLGAIVVGPSPDLAYLIGYDPPPFERPTVLVLRPDRDPMLVVPQLERALAAVSGAGDLVELAILGGARPGPPGGRARAVVDVGVAGARAPPRAQGPR